MLTKRNREEVMFGISHHTHNRTDFIQEPQDTLLLITNVLLLLGRQMETPVSSVKVAVHRRSPRLPYSLRAMGVWSGQIPFLSDS